MKKSVRIIALFLAITLVCSLAVYADSSYTVVSGDSLWGIANKFGISVDALMNANGLTKEGIQIGQVLKIPDGSSGGSSGSNPNAGSNVGSGNIEIPEDAPVGNGYDIPTLSVDFIDAISFEVVDTDIRDILNIIANYAGKKIIYLGEPQKISVTCSLVSCMKAISLVVEAADGLTYISDGSFILVGPESRISSVMMYSDMTKVLTLTNLTASEFSAILEKLGIDTSVITAVDANKITVTAQPRELARIVNAQYMIDKKANFPVDELTQTNLFNLVSFKPQFATREIMKAFSDSMSLRLTYLSNYSDDGMIYVTGSKGATADLEKLLTIIDTNENVFGSNKLSVYTYTVSAISRDELVSKMTAAGYGNVLFVTQEGNKKTVYFIGTQMQIASAATYADSINKAS